MFEVLVETKAIVFGWPYPLTALTATGASRYPSFALTADDACGIWR